MTLALMTPAMSLVIEFDGKAALIANLLVR